MRIKQQFADDAAERKMNSEKEFKQIKIDHKAERKAWKAELEEILVARRR